jgi:hypothetical protein
MNSARGRVSGGQRRQHCPVSSRLIDGTLRHIACNLGNSRRAGCTDGVCREAVPAANHWPLRAFTGTIHGPELPTAINGAQNAPICLVDVAELAEGTVASRLMV